jgi:DNA helicase-2/ATP-dependent DNA helicase PcrA
VFLPCLTDGAVPIVYAQTAEAIEEERRLLYVGITRARDRLFLSWALARAPGGKRTRKPSRFLDGLRGPMGKSGPSAPSGSAGPDGAGKRRSPRRSREPALPSLTGTVPQGGSSAGRGLTE